MTPLPTTLVKANPQLTADEEAAINKLANVVKRHIQVTGENQAKFLKYLEASLFLEAARQLITEHKELVYLVDCLMHQVRWLKAHKKESTERLTTVMTNTYKRLTGEMSKEDYEASVKTMQWQSTIGLKVLGGIMLALGIAVLVLGIVFFPAAVAGAAAIVGAVAAPAVAGIAVGITSAGLVGTSALGFFARSETTLSGQMNTLNNEMRPDEQYKASVTA